MERGICPIAPLALRLNLYSFTGSQVWPLGSRNVIGHVTMGTTVRRILFVIRWHHVPISHGCWDIEPQTFRGHDLDPFGSRDIISHVTIGTADGRFLLVIHWHHIPGSCTVAEILSVIIWITISRWKHTGNQFWGFLGEGGGGGGR